MINLIFPLCLALFLCDANIVLDAPNGSVQLNDELAEMRRDMAEMKRNHHSRMLQSEVIDLLFRRGISNSIKYPCITRCRANCAGAQRYLLTILSQSLVHLPARCLRSTI